MPAPHPFLRLRNVSGKAHAGSCPARALSLELEQGERLALLGPARSGKTSALALIGGFGASEGGEVTLAGRDLAGIPPWRRSIALVQAAADLLEDRSIADNLGLVASLRAAGRAGSRERVARALAAVGRSHLGDQPAGRLAADDRRRVAVARALLAEPALLVLDEPFARLDPGPRQALREGLRELLRSRRLTAILATAEPADAFAFGERIAVLRDGAIAELGTPGAIYQFPSSVYVARCTGEANCLAGVVEAIDDDLAAVRLDGGPTVFAAAINAPRAGERCVVMIRPERVALAAIPAEDMGGDAVPVVVDAVAYRGAQLQIAARLAGSAALTILRPAAAGTQGLAVGQAAAIAWQAGDALALAWEPAE
jgi:putative spermidine/putrescine transport system ATP-binding protein